jgi:hypothetical protein
MAKEIHAIDKPHVGASTSENPLSGRRREILPKN